MLCQVRLKTYHKSKASPDVLPSFQKILIPRTDFPLKSVMSNWPGITGEVVVLIVNNTIRFFTINQIFSTFTVCVRSMLILETTLQVGKAVC